MKSTFYNIIQTKGVKVLFCAFMLTSSVITYAQDDMEDPDEEIGFKAPKRKVVEDKTPTIAVNGTVIDQATKQPIAGVRVQALNNSKYTAMTNAEGKFTINVPVFATSLYVQAPRYSAQQVAIKSNDPKQVVNIQLLGDKFTKMYDEGTIYTAQNSITAKGTGITIDDEIASRLGADMHSIMRSGDADAGAAMFIRGINSLNGNAQPLVIIDGVEYDMQQDRTTLHTGEFFNMLSAISPQDIDKVTVLKNATALYGSRGANGVVLIETKRGHSMATRIDANISAGVTLKPKQMRLMNASQYRNYAVEMIGTLPATQQFDPANSANVMFKFLNDDPNGYYYHTFHNNTDWKDFVYKEAMTQNYSINVQGGDDIGMYNLSVGYTDAKNPVETTSFDRVNVRFNTDISILYNLSTKIDMSFSRTNNYVLDDGIPADLNSGTITSPTFLSWIKSPMLYPYQYNQNVGGFTSLLYGADDMFSQLGPNYSLANPLTYFANGEGDNKNKMENTMFNIHVQPTYTINDNLKVTTLFSYYLNRNSQRYYRPYEGVPSFDIPSLGTVTAMTASLFGKETNIISNTHIDWNKKFGAHDVAVTGGFRYNYFLYDSNDLSTQYTDQNGNDKDPHLSGSASNYPGVSGANDSWKNMQWYVSGDYNYKNRYFATVSLLAEANSRFGKDIDSALKVFGTNWAFFPSVQLGWVMTNEDWFPKNAGINYLRVNAGFDVSGNDNISNYAARTSYTSVRYNGYSTGIQLTNVGNDKIKWETSQKFNFGVKAYMLNNRLGVNFDYFYNRISDLLSLKTFENPIGGINNYWVNDGVMINKGFEFGLNGKPIVSKNLTLEAGFTMGHYVNTIKHLANGNYTTSVYGDNNILTAVGGSANVFYGYKTKGVFSTDAEAKAAGNGGYLYFKDNAGKIQNFTAGDVHFVDQNGDGMITEADKVVIGNPNPDVYGNVFATLNYKRFTFDMNFTYCLGNDVYNYQRSVLNSGSTLYNQQVSEVDRWRYEGQNATLPKLAYGDPMGNNRFSDRWIEDGSYLRMKSFTVAYSIPVPESWQSWLQGLSVWGEARNIFTLTRYTGSDPEFSAGNSIYSQGIDCGNLAHSRSFVLGLKVNL